MAPICAQETGYGNAVWRVWLFSSNDKKLHRFIFELLLQIPRVNRSLPQRLSHTAVKKTSTCFEAKGQILTSFAQVSYWIWPVLQETQGRSEPGPMWDPAMQGTEVHQISLFQMQFSYITLGGCPTLQALLDTVSKPVWGAGETGGPVTLESVAWTSP